MMIEAVRGCDVRHDAIPPSWRRQRSWLRRPYPRKRVRKGQHTAGLGMFLQRLLTAFYDRCRGH